METRLPSTGPSSCRQLLTFRESAPPPPDRTSSKYSAPQFDPGRRVVAGLLHRPDVPVNARRLQPRRQLRAQEQVVDAEPRVAGEGAPHVVPERVDRLIRVQVPQRVRPALGEQP